MAALELELELESEVSVRAEDGDRVGESMVMWGETGDSDSLFEPSFVFLSEDEPAEGLADDAVVTGVGAPEPAPEPAAVEPKPPNTGTIVIKEDIMDPKPDPESTKQTNSDIMKEVISLDKKEEQIDETISLDNFFTDVKKLADPMNTMEPIKEESKYTLFEDAPQNE